MKQWSLKGLMSGAWVSLLLMLGSSTWPAPALCFEPLSSPGRVMFVQESVDQVVGEAAISLRRGLRQLGRSTVLTVSRAINAWGRYVRRGVKFAFLALLIALADRNLLAAWRSSGLRILTNYVPLMAYVYTRLLFDRRVYGIGKALLFGALAYCIVRRDLIPDRTLVPGLVDDVVLLVIAVRLLLNWCNDEVVYAHATDAVNRWGRIASFQRARQR